VGRAVFTLREFSMSVTAFHEKAGRSQEDSFCFLLDKVARYIGELPKAHQQ